MKYCTKCGTQCEDNVAVCPSCGNKFEVAAAKPVDNKDHTAEFDAKDISDNKVVSMLPYLLGIIGVIVAAILATDSPYAKFHVGVALKYTVVEAILIIVSAVLAFTFIVPIAGGICLIIVFVLRVISFIQICQGKAKDPAIIGSFGFLK